MVTISLTELLVGILVVAAIVLVIYLIVMVGKLLPSLSHLEKILADAEVIVKDVRETSGDAKGAVTKLSASLVDVSDLLKGNKSFVAAGSNLVNAAASLRGLMKQDSDKDGKK